MSCSSPLLNFYKVLVTRHWQYGCVPVKAARLLCIHKRPTLLHLTRSLSSLHDAILRKHAFRTPIINTLFSHKKKKTTHTLYTQKASAASPHFFASGRNLPKTRFSYTKKKKILFSHKKERKKNTLFMHKRPTLLQFTPSLSSQDAIFRKHTFVHQKKIHFSHIKK